MTSAVAVFQVAIVAALKADVPFRSLLATPTSVFSLRAPQGSQRPYVVMGSSGELPGDQFGRRGSMNDELIHIWGKQEHKMEVLAIYKEMARVLEGPLTVTGFESRPSRVDLVMVMSDPEDNLAHGIVRYGAQHVI